jgi:ATP-binding cassette, subfamily C, bacterial exporter for protease/lipase
MKTPRFFARSELTRALWAFKDEFKAVGVFSFVANLLLLVPTLYMLQVYDRVLVSQSELTLLVVSLVALFMLAMMSFSEWSRSRVLVRAGVRFDQQLSTRVFNASFEAYLNQSRESPAKAFSDLIQIRQFITGQGIFAFFDAPWTPIYIVVVFMLHPLLGVLALVFSMFQVALAWFGHRNTVAPSEAAQKAGFDATSYLQSKLRNAEVIESMGMLDNLRHRWSNWHRAYLARNTDAHAISSRVMAWSKFIRYSQQSLALGAGALLVIDGQLSAGAMIATNLLISRALAPIDQMIGAWRSGSGAWAAFLRLEKLLVDNPERDPNLSRLAPTGDLTLRGVVASAPGRVSPILKGIDLRVPSGTVVAVLGPSGSGKSTMARVMMGIWPDVGGEVLLDGLPIQSWDRVELGPHLGYLPQDIELFEGSIAENIARFGDVDSEKVIAAARCAGLHEMILRFPKGYDTSIGEAGNLLSGGQRQRIGLARAIYGDPALIVLDEPNANLDDAGEMALVKTVLELKEKGKTIFLITHRPGAIAVADRVVVLQDGKIRADGTRDAVLAQLRASQPERPQPPLGGLQPA